MVQIRNLMLPIRPCSVSVRRKKMLMWWWMYFPVINCWRARRWICQIRLYVSSIHIGKVMGMVSLWISVWWGTDRFIRNRCGWPNGFLIKRWLWSGKCSVINCVRDKRKNGSWRLKRRKDKLLTRKCWQRCMMPPWIKYGIGNRISKSTIIRLFHILIGWVDIPVIIHSIIGGIRRVSKCHHWSMTILWCYRTIIIMEEIWVK